MRFFFPEIDDRLLLCGGYANVPEKTLDEMYDSFRIMDHTHSKITLTCELELPNAFQPSAIWSRVKKVLLLKQDWMDRTGFALPASCEVGSLETTNCGRFRAFAMIALEKLFQAHLDFRKSQFDAIGSYVFGFDPSGHIKATKTDAENMSDLESERPGMDHNTYWLPSHSNLLKDWPWSVVAFDRLIYLRGDIDLTDSGLKRAPMHIDVSWA